MASKSKVVRRNNNGVNTTQTAPAPLSFQGVITFVNQNFGLLVLILIFFLGGFVVGSLWTENQLLKSNKLSDAGAQPTVAGVPSQPTAPEGPTKDQLAKVPQVTKDDHLRGKQTAQITLIEYSDFECPYCQRFHPTMQQIMKEYGDKVSWVYRQYPLSFHPNAQRAAETSECVAKFGGNDAFWKYTDAIYVEQAKLGGKLNDDAIATAIAASGVTASQVDGCVQSGEMTQKVKAQAAAGSTAGISGTPGTILVTKTGEYELISGAVPAEQVKSIIDQYL